MGRFLTRDPFGIWRDAGNFGNAYAYAGNNPLIGVDPTGKRDDWFTTVEKAPNDPTGNKQIASLGGHSYEFDVTQGPDLFEYTVYMANQPIIIATANIGVSFYPPGGEIQDGLVLNDPSASKWEKALASASLFYSGFTGGFGPNAGSFIRSSDEIVEGVNSLVNTGRKLEKTTDGLKSVDAGKSAAAADAGTSANKASNAAEVTGDARFVGQPDGTVVDTHSTPPGRYKQPNKDMTDVLQRNDNGHGQSHTHEVDVHINPRDPSKGKTKKTDRAHPVTAEEAKNIVDQYGAVAICSMVRSSIDNVVLLRLTLFPTSFRSSPPRF